MKKFVFFSNYLNHHQLPFCKEMLKLTNNGFLFVSQKAISEKRIALGYQNISNDYDFNLKTYESNDNLKEAYKLADESEIVLFGSSNEDYIKNRIKSNKLTFKYSERLVKNRLNILDYLRMYRRIYVNHTRYKKNNLFMLCSGTYAAYDFNRFGAYKNKTYKWGYFPETIEYKEQDLINKKNNDKISILWAGRLIDWKHPEYAIELANLLKKNNYQFSLNVIGQGVMEEELQSLINEYELNDYVNMLGSMPPKQVREYMEKANIFIFTSNMHEGWGAVLNEAMNSGCACVASHLIGSAGYLIKHKENGLVYEDGNLNDLFNKVKSLIDDKAYREKISKKAYQTIIETWNAKVAAKRLLELAESIKENKDIDYIDGPCSKAYPTNEDDILKLIKE